MLGEDRTRAPPIRGFISDCSRTRPAYRCLSHPLTLPALDASLRRANRFKPLHTLCRLHTVSTKTSHMHIAQDTHISTTIIADVTGTQSHQK